MWSFLRGLWRSWFPVEQVKVEPPIVTPRPKRPKAAKRPKQKRCPMIDKVMFDEQGAKQRAAKSTETIHGTHLRAYKCEFCPAWHLSHKKAYKM